MNNLLETGSVGETEVRLIKLYLAASFSRQAEMRAVAAQLTGLGIEITSRWLAEDQGMKHGNAHRKFMLRCAVTDLEDVRRADIIVRFSDDLSPETIPSHLGTGARHFECGYAFALGKPVFVVGGHQNVFDFLPVTHFKTTKDLLDYLNQRRSISAWNRRHLHRNG